MRSKLVVKVKDIRREYFASPPMIVTFIVGVLFILVVLFPQQSLRVSIGQQSKSNMVTVTYLQNLLRVYPADLNLRLLLAQQQVGLDRFIRAERTLAPIDSHHQPSYVQRNIAWLQYEILRKRTFAAKPNSVVREQLEKELVIAINQLKNQPFSANHLELMAKDALAINNPALAVSLYELMLNRFPVKNVQWLMVAAKASMGIGKYQRSAEFYLTAMSLSRSNKDKNLLYLSAIKSLQAGNQLEEALLLAEDYYEPTFGNRKTLLYLSRLALAANQPDLAEGYIKQALEVTQNTKPDSSHERHE